jgi:hypothetical protein
VFERYTDGGLSRNRSTPSGIEQRGTEPIKHPTELAQHRQFRRLEAWVVLGTNPVREWHV